MRRKCRVVLAAVATLLVAGPGAAFVGPSGRPLLVQTRPPVTVLRHAAVLRPTRSLRVRMQAQPTTEGKIADEALASEAVVDPFAVPEGVVCDGKGMCVLAEEPECIPDGMSRLQFWRGTRTHFVSDSAFSPARVSADMYLTGER